MRTLHLTSPNMEGDDVRKVQAHLGLLTDGIYGPATGSAVAAWKYRMGFPRSAVNTGIGPEGQRIMFRARGEKLPTAYRKRRLERMRIGFKPGWGIPKVPPFTTALALATMVGWAERGWHEQPAKSNVVPEMVTLGRELGIELPGMGFPWCAHAAMLSNVVHGGVTGPAGIGKGGEAGDFNGRYCPTILSEAQQGRHGMQIIGASQALPGDLVIFNFDGGLVDHIGRARRAPNGAVVDTVEANTSKGAAGSQNNGDGVYLRTRPLSQITAFIRDS